MTLKNLNTCPRWLMKQTPYMSYQAQLNLVIEKREIKENFLGFYKTHLTDDETLHKLIISNFGEPDPKNLIVQNYDGAGNTLMHHSFCM